MVKYIIFVAHSLWFINSKWRVITHFLALCLSVCYNLIISRTMKLIHWYYYKQSLTFLVCLLYCYFFVSLDRYVLRIMCWSPTWESKYLKNIIRAIRHHQCEYYQQRKFSCFFESMLAMMHLNAVGSLSMSFLCWFCYDVSLRGQYSGCAIARLFSVLILTYSLIMFIRKR